MSVSNWVLMTPWDNGDIVCIWGSPRVNNSPGHLLGRLSLGLWQLHASQGFSPFLAVNRGNTDSSLFHLRPPPPNHPGIRKHWTFLQRTALVYFPLLGCSFLFYVLFMIPMGTKSHLRIQIVITMLVTSCIAPLDGTGLCSTKGEVWRGGSAQQGGRFWWQWGMV